MEAGVDGLPSCCCSWVLLLEAAALVWEKKLEGNGAVGAGAAVLRQLKREDLLAVLCKAG